MKKLLSMPRGMLIEASVQAFFRLTKKLFFGISVKPACSWALERVALMISM